ncbi:hypothetical protein L9F63_007701, partial [Diploptera punctata]
SNITLCQLFRNKRSQFSDKNVLLKFSFKNFFMEFIENEPYVTEVPVTILFLIFLVMILSSDSINHYGE